jgi:hypothetical protein
MFTVGTGACALHFLDTDILILFTFHAPLPFGIIQPAVLYRFRLWRVACNQLSMGDSVRECVLMPLC